MFAPVKAVKAYREEKIELQICRDVNSKFQVSAALARREYTAKPLKRALD
jgi:hypothetical protein